MEDQDDMYARVIDGGLAGYIGKSTIELEYRDWWPEIQGISPDVEVHIRGEVTVGYGNCDDQPTIPNMPLCMSFEHGAGKVVYTSFLNEAQDDEEDAIAAARKVVIGTANIKPILPTKVLMISSATIS